MTLSEPDPSDVATAIRYDVGLTAFSERILSTIAREAQALGRICSVHLKVDTGTHRAGCAPGALAVLVARAYEEKWLRLDSVWSQFAAATDEYAAESSADALDIFLKTVGSLELDDMLFHIANSAAAISMPDSRLNMVRCGISLYGYLGRPESQSPIVLGLRPAIRVIANVRSVRIIEIGDLVGYGSQVVAPRRMLLGNVGVGYAHGVPRNWGLSGGWVGIDGRRAPVIGALSMEQMLVDLGDPDLCPSIRAGASVIVLGDGADGPSAAQMAGATGTIPNEILCRVGLSPLRKSYIRYSA